MTKTLIGGIQYGYIVRNDLDRIAKGVDNASVWELHIAKERVLRTAR
jgi:hypothetical protein